MELRLVEAYHKKKSKKGVCSLLDNCDVIDHRIDDISSKESISRIVVEASKIDGVIEALSKEFGDDEGFRLVVLPVNAMIPRFEPDEQAEDGRRKTPDRISIPEIYQKLYDKVDLDRTFISLLIISAVIAAIGLLRDDVAVIIGSMIVAPLLIPNEALALSTTLADRELGRKALRTSVFGYLITFLCGLAFGFFYVVDLSSRALAARTEISFLFILLAFASGVAGTFSLTKGVSETRVGVMIAVALLPPLVASGLLFGEGLLREAEGALIIFLINLACVNLAGIITFNLQGVTPRKWYQRKKAEKAVWRAEAVWLIVLVILVGLIFLYNRI